MTQPTSSPGKSIYLDGEILEGVNEIAGKKIYVPGDNFTKYPCPPPHNFTNYQPVVEGKDYVKQWQADDGICWINVEKSIYDLIVERPRSRRIIAIPLQPNECYFTPKKDTTSATICANCGKERLLHTIGEGIKATTVIITSQPTVQNDNKEGKKEFFLPPDEGEGWNIGAETFTRKEVFNLLYTQRAMISNDIKRECNLDSQDILLSILDNPRIPKF